MRRSAISTAARERHAEDAQPGRRRSDVHGRKAGNRRPCSRRSNFRLIATGPMRIDTRIKDVGTAAATGLQGEARRSRRPACKARSSRAAWSDPTSSSKPRPPTRRVLPRCSTSRVCPRRRSRVSGHTVWSRKEIKFDSLTAAIADASVRADGSMRLTGDRKIALNFEVAAASLAKLRDTLPELTGRGQRRLRIRQGPYRTERSAGHPGQDAAGRFAAADGSQADRGGAVVAASRPHAILPAGTASRSGARQGRTAADRRPAAPEPKKKFVFSETPLPVAQDEGHRREGASGLRRTGARRSVIQGPRQQPAGWITAS